MVFNRWKLGDFAPCAGIAAGAHADDFADQDWLDILAPVMSTAR